jgi:hypothetical protein
MLQCIESRDIVLQLIDSSREIWNACGLRRKEEPADGTECDERSEHDGANAKESHLTLREDERAIRESAFALHVNDHRARVRRVDVPVPALSGSVLALSHHSGSSNPRFGRV